MHYIRILKPPRVLPKTVSTPLNLSAKITITTDLGESFLFSNISLIAELELEDGINILGARNGREYTWKGRDGMRSLEIVVPIPTLQAKQKMDGEVVRMVVRPKEEELAVDSYEKLLDTRSGDSEDKGGVVTVRSMAIDISTGAKADKAPGVGMAERLFSMGTEDNKKRVRIWEETGESIARHIWDAGLVLSSYLVALSSSHSSPSTGHTIPQLPELERVLQKKSPNVLELGAGCGIVGITLATLFPSLHQVLLTDLPEATSILSHNLSPATLSLPLSTLSKLSHQVLDWSSPLPPNVKSTNWDLVVVADCTYNPDVVPDLVATLGVLGGEEGNGDVAVLLAMKVRHESEMVFFELMREAGFEVQEKCKILLPVLGGEGEEIEIFVFGYGK